MEPLGTCEVINHTTGEKAICDFPGRGYFSSAKEVAKIVVKDKDGKDRFEISGRYTEKLEMKDLSSGEMTEVWKCPDFLPKNAEKMFNMSTFGIQLNMSSEELMKKLPPTDTRRREDVRAWEGKNVPVAAK